MRRISFGFVLAASIAGTPAVAQQATTGGTPGTAGEQEVLAVVKALFTALKAKDTATMRSLHEPGARLVLTATRDGRPRIRPVPLDEFLQIIARNESAIEERIFEPQVRIDDNLATVWNRYEFLVDGKPDHCGVDAFQLARFAEGWKVYRHCRHPAPLRGCRVAVTAAGESPALPPVTLPAADSPGYGAREYETPVGEVEEALAEVWADSPSGLPAGHDKARRAAQGVDARFRFESAQGRHLSWRDVARGNRAPGFLHSPRTRCDHAPLPVAAAIAEGGPMRSHHGAVDRRRQTPVGAAGRRAGSIHRLEDGSSTPGNVPVRRKST